MTIAARVKKIIAEQVLKNEDQIDDKQSLRDDLGFDSLDEIKVVMFIEEELEIEIDDTSIENLKTVGDLIACVEGIARKAGA